MIPDFIEALCNFDVYQSKVQSLGKPDLKILRNAPVSDFKEPYRVSEDIIIEECDVFECRIVPFLRVFRSPELSLFLTYYAEIALPETSSARETYTSVIFGIQRIIRLHVFDFRRKYFLQINTTTTDIYSGVRIIRSQIVKHMGVFLEYNRNIYLIRNIATEPYLITLRHRNSVTMSLIEG